MCFIRESVSDASLEERTRKHFKKLVLKPFNYMTAV